MDTIFEHIYIHLPFCEVICHYCDFYTVRAKEARHEDLFQALRKEVKFYEKNLAPELKAIYFGGGTPSASPADQIEKFLSLFKDRTTKNTEITLEANPTDIHPNLVRTWKKAGVNRLSLGIQSLDSQILKRLGRVHTGDQARRALEICLNEVENVTGDLIYAVPGQSLEQPSEHAEEMAKIGVKHFSAYHLTISKDHFLYSKLPDSDFAWKQVQAIERRLNPLGFRHYEVSNFSRPGFESVNNQNYWYGGSYLALGPSAHGFDGKLQRWKNIENWQKYIATVNEGKSSVGSMELLSLEQRKIEVLFTNLRTARGICLEEFQKQFQISLETQHGAQLNHWIKEGLAKIANGHFILTFEGRMLADEIATKLI